MEQETRRVVDEGATHALSGDISAGAPGLGRAVAEHSLRDIVAFSEETLNAFPSVSLAEMQGDAAVEDPNEGQMEVVWHRTEWVDAGLSSGGSMLGERGRGWVGGLVIGEHNGTWYADGSVLPEVDDKAMRFHCVAPETTDQAAGLTRRTWGMLTTPSPRREARNRTQGIPMVTGRSPRQDAPMSPPVGSLGGWPVSLD